MGALLPMWSCVGQPITDALCGPTTCAGCCGRAGRCVSGTDVSACGEGGAACSACSPGLECQAGRCAPPRPRERCDDVLVVGPGGGRGLASEPRAAAEGAFCDVDQARGALVSVEAPAGAAVVIRVSSPNGTAVLAPETSCGGNERASTLPCLAAPRPGGAAAVVIPSFGPRPLLLRVGTVEADGAVVAVETEVRPADTTCEGLPTLPLDARGLQLATTDRARFGLDVGSDGSLRLSGAALDAVRLEATCGAPTLVETVPGGGYEVTPGRLVVHTSRPQLVAFELATREPTTCGADETLELPPDGGLLVVPNRRLASTRRSPCTGALQGEHRVRLVTPRSGIVEVRLVADAPAAGATLWQTGPDCLERPSTCVAAPGAEPVNARIRIPERDGFVFSSSVIVGLGGPVGASVSLEARFRAQATNDRCGGPGPMRFLDVRPPITTAAFQGSLVDAANDTQPACAPNGLADVYLPLATNGFDPDTRFRLRFARTDGGGPAFLSVGCRPQQCLGPIDSSTEFVASSATDGVWLSGNPDLTYELVVSREALPPGESCPRFLLDGGLGGPMAPVVPDDGGRVSLDLDLSAATADLRGLCTGLAPDLVLTLPQVPTSEFVLATAQALDPGVLPFLTVSSTCADPATTPLPNASCSSSDDAGVARVRTRSGGGQPNRSHFLHLQNLGRPGRVRVTLERDGPPGPLDTCSGALRPTLTDGGATSWDFDFTELGADGAMPPDCVAPPVPGTELRDGYLRWSLSQPMRLELRLESLSDGLETALELVALDPSQPQCAFVNGSDTLVFTSPPLACGLAGPGRSAVVTTPLLPQGQYGLVVVQVRGSGRARLELRPLP
ncbi:MAG: hypothetical protein SFW67_15665 [Myxococcaceae bacterium]|nr:hypothetical protein [Myxococcaceae bacterium]